MIQNLMKEVEELRLQAAESAGHKKELAKLKKENDKLSAENKTLSTSLASAQKETKTLTSKLAAARSSALPDTKNVPGSAVKPRSVVLPGSKEAAEEMHIRQQKENIYSDLTDLLIVGVKKGEEGEDVYDCIQTGRNGSMYSWYQNMSPANILFPALHFHLSIAPTSDGESYNDAEFVYCPLLNENRDKELLDILPEYLTEEIAFPRNHASKFYAKVVDCMTKKVIIEE